MVSPKPLVVRLARGGTGDTVGAGQGSGARLVDRIMKTVATHRGVGRDRAACLAQTWPRHSQIVASVWSCVSPPGSAPPADSVARAGLRAIRMIHQTATFSVDRQPRAACACKAARIAVLAASGAPKCSGKPPPSQMASMSGGKAGSWRGLNRTTSAPAAAKASMFS